MRCVGRRLRAALNLTVGRGISAAAGTAAAGTLVMTTMRSMAVGAIKTAAAVVLVIGVAIAATVLAGKGRPAWSRRPMILLRPVAMRKPFRESGRSPRSSRSIISRPMTRKPS